MSYKNSHHVPAFKHCREQSAVDNRSARFFSTCPYQLRIFISCSLIIFWQRNMEKSQWRQCAAAISGFERLASFCIPVYLISLYPIITVQRLQRRIRITVKYVQNSGIFVHIMRFQSKRVIGNSGYSWGCFRKVTLIFPYKFKQFLTRQSLFVIVIAEGHCKRNATRHRWLEHLFKSFCRRFSGNKVTWKNNKVGLFLIKDTVHTLFRHNRMLTAGNPMNVSELYNLELPVRTEFQRLGIKYAVHCNAQDR